MIHRMLLLAAFLVPGLVAAQTPYECGPGNATDLQHGETQASGRKTSGWRNGLFFDPDIYCAMAGAGFDFLWIEMQHSPLSYSEVARMIWACRGAPAMPFIRVPDATEGDIQKAVDMGAVGIIIPMVESLEKVKAAIKFAKYPPLGARSQGGGQYGSLWGSDYRKNANDNIMIVAMIESPAGVAIAEQSPALPGVDAVFAASTDLSSFSGLRQGDPQYEAMVTKIHDLTLKYGKGVGRPLGLEESCRLQLLSSAGRNSLSFVPVPAPRLAARLPKVRQKESRR